MSRTIKFRARLQQTGKWFYWSVQDTIGPHDIRMGEDIDWETLGEFTGQKDRNGVEIFEADIVKVYHGQNMFEPDTWTVGAVYWDDDTLTWCLENWQQGGSNWTGYYIEVIGNRFENPELLTKEAA